MELDLQEVKIFVDVKVMDNNLWFSNLKYGFTSMRVSTVITSS